jgi:tRNA-dihydrouridine synthase A
MIVSGALIHGDAAHFLAHRQDEPAAVQLGGSNPQDLSACAVQIEDAGYQEINLNVGCPSDRVQQGGIGACLMAEPELVADCVSAMQSGVSIPVTVKCRIGIDDKDSYDFFENFIRVVHEAGCRTFIVHARKAVLSGFSPKDNREIPPLKYDYVYDIQAALPDTVFILNGGLKTGSQVREQLEIVKGVMLGRAVYSNPYLLAELENQVFATPMPERKLVAAMYRDYMNEKMKSGTHLKHMVKHMLGLFAGIPGARAYRRYLSENMFREHAGIEVLDKALELVQNHSEAEPVDSLQAELQQSDLIQASK